MCRFIVTLLSFFLNQSKWKNKKVKKFKEFVSFWGQEKNLYNVNCKKKKQLRSKQKCTYEKNPLKWEN